jgi:hypothetical protein
VLEQRGYDVQRVATTSIDHARSEAADRALADGADELVWIDGDITFQPDDVARLRSHEVPVVGAVCAHGGGFEVQLLPGAADLPVGAQGGLVEVAGIGLGFTLVRRAALAALAAPYFLPMIAAGSGGASYLDAGFALCHRARAAGVRVYADTMIRVGRLGAHAYPWETAGG